MNVKIENPRFLLKDKHYGNTGCRVFKRVLQMWKDFSIKINIPKEIIEF